MKIETIKTEKIGQSVSVVSSAVSSLRKNHEIEHTVRVYDDGFVGIAGALGNADDEALTAKARLNLNQKIPYPEIHREPKVESHLTATTIIPDGKIVETVEKLIKKLAEQNPDYIFSNKFNVEYFSREYSDSDGAKLAYDGKDVQVALLGKYKPSANIFDVFVGGVSRVYDEGKILADAKLSCENYKQNADFDLPDEMPCIISLEDIGKAFQGLHAEMYACGSSIYSGKLGQRVFSDKLNVLMDRSPEQNTVIPFFDAEGVIHNDCKRSLIQNGVLCGLVGTEKIAEKTKLDCQGFASAPYDGAPSASFGGLTVLPTAKSLEEILQHKQALFVYTTSGGDMTQTGDVALPVQAAFLYQDNKFSGKVPEFTLVGNIFSLLGDNFLGATDKGIYLFGDNLYLVFNAKINK